MRRWIVHWEAEEWTHFLPSKKDTELFSCLKIPPSIVQACHLEIDLVSLRKLLEVFHKDLRN